MQIRYKLLGLAALALVCTSFGTSALTLGRVRGAAVVGQGLDVSIAVQLDGDESASNLCMEADVFHADTRVDSGRVRVTVEPAQAAQTANVRVTSSVSIDEPVVTIYLKAGCNQKSTRRYVMLADFASEPAAPVANIAPANVPTVVVPASGPAVVSAAQPTNAVVGNAPPAAVASSAAAPAASAAPSSAAPTRVPATPKLLAPKPAVKKPQPAANVPAKSAPAQKPATRAKAAAAIKPGPSAEAVVDKQAAGRDAGQSRLKLDPLSSLTERVATLESSSSVPLAAMIKEAERVQTLEGSVKALVALATKNEASMLDMKIRLQKAEAVRDSNPLQWLVFALAALVLACLGGMAWLWTRLQRRGPVPSKDDWWSPSKRASLEAAQGSADGSAHEAGGRSSAKGALGDQGGDDEMDFTPQATQKITTAERSKAMNLRDDAASQMDVSLVEMSESNFDNLMQSGQAHSALRKGPLPPPVPTPRTQVQPLDVKRTINSDQLFDLRQQSAFYVSLGQTDQAVRVLEAHINEHGESSPLIYLDLLQIFHGMGLRADYLQFREDFNLLFNSKVPEFSAYGEEGRALEEYPHLLAHIGALWATPKALMVIEAAVFRDPMDDKSPPFDLAAFRDLLLLHGVAQFNTNRDAALSQPMPLQQMPGLANAGSGSLARSDQTIQIRPKAAVAPGRTSGSGSGSASGSASSQAAVELDLDFSDFDNSQVNPVDIPLGTVAIQVPKASGAVPGNVAQGEGKATGKPASQSERRSESRSESRDGEGKLSDKINDSDDFPVIVSPPAVPPAVAKETPAASAAIKNMLDDGNLLDFNLSEAASLPLPKAKPNR